MMDIVSIGNDLGLFDTQAPRAANILSVQVGDLEYAGNLGIDLRFFLRDDFRFQNESFKAYLIEVLANRGINVASILEIIDNLHVSFGFNLSPEENDSGLVAR